MTSECSTCDAVGVRAPEKMSELSTGDAGGVSNASISSATGSADGVGKIPESNQPDAGATGFTRSISSRSPTAASESWPGVGVAVGILLAASVAVGSGSAVGMGTIGVASSPMSNLEVASPSVPPKWNVFEGVRVMSGGGGNAPAGPVVSSPSGCGTFGSSPEEDRSNSNDERELTPGASSTGVPTSTGSASATSTTSAIGSASAGFVADAIPDSSSHPDTGETASVTDVGSRGPSTDSRSGVGVVVLVGG